jgi:hypothetical protein
VVFSSLKSTQFTLETEAVMAEKNNRPQTRKIFSEKVTLQDMASVQAIIEGSDP